MVYLHCSHDDVLWSLIFVCSRFTEVYHIIYKQLFRINQQQKIASKRKVNKFIQIQERYSLWHMPVNETSKTARSL